MSASRSKNKRADVGRKSIILENIISVMERMENLLILLYRRHDGGGGK